MPYPIASNLKAKGDYSAIVYKEGDLVIAEDNEGKVIAKGEAGVDDGSVIQAALDSLTPNRTWKEKIILIGDFIASGIKIPSYTIFELQGKITNPNPSANCIIEITESNIELIGGVYDGNRGSTYNTDDSNLNGSGIYTHGETSDVAPENITVRDITVKNTYNRGIVVRNLKKSLFDNVTIENAGWGGFDLAVASGAPYPSLCMGNTLRKITVLNSQVVGISPGLSTGNELIACYVDTITKPSEFTGIANGIGIDSARNLDVVGCTVRNCEDGISIHTSIDSNPFQITVKGCKTFSNTRYGYYLGGARSCKLIGAKSYEDNVGVYVGGGYGNYLDVQLKNNKKQGIYCKDTRNLTITGRIEDADRDGEGNYAIHLSGVLDCMIIGMHVEEVETPRTMNGLLIEDANLTSNRIRIVYSDLQLTATKVTITSAGTDFYFKKVRGYLSENSGTATFSGDGSTTQFSIEHGLVSTPSKVQVTPMTEDASGDFYVTADDTYIYINYKTAPPSGTDNVKVSWHAEV